MPDDFWKETPRSYINTMEGIGLAAKRIQDNAISLAWHTAAFNAMTKSKKGLGDLRKYLSTAAKPKPQSAEEMIAVLQEFKERGAPMNISHSVH